MAIHPVLQHPHVLHVLEVAQMPALVAIHLALAYAAEHALKVAEVVVITLVLMLVWCIVLLLLVKFIIQVTLYLP